MTENKKDTQTKPIVKGQSKNAGSNSLQVPVKKKFTGEEKITIATKGEPRNPFDKQSGRTF